MTEGSEGIPQKIDLVDATPEDIDEVLQVKREGWLDTFTDEQLGLTPEIINEICELSMPKDRKEFEELLKKPEAKFLVARKGRKVAGFITLAREEDCNWLGYFFVRKEYRGKGEGNRGVGSDLWHAVRKFADPKNETILNTVASNEQALNVYKHYGFEPNGRSITRVLQAADRQFLQPMVQLSRKPDDLTEIKK